jgi:phosphatidylglycerol---prolipoprotein diacylglyceryl transferase
MYPLLFNVGPIPVYGYGVMLALAFSLGALALLRQSREAGFPEEKVLNLIIIIFFSAMLGSRLVYILAWEMQGVLRNPLLILDFGGGGLSFHGGFFFAALAGGGYVLYSRLPLGRVADMTAPYIALGYGITRVGCFLKGCCYGRVSQVPWALPISLQDPVLRHPTQLYGVLAGLCIYAILRVLEKRSPNFFPGFLLLALTALYSIYRFALEFFRQEEPVFFRVLTLGQFISVGMLVLSLALIYYFWRRRGCGGSDGEKGIS